MPANFWPEDDSSNELAPLNSLLSDLSATEELVVETEPLFLPFRFQGRRRKAALVLTIVWSITIALHLVSWGFLFVLGLTTILGIHALEVVFARPRRHPKQMQGDLPSVSVLVS